MQHTIEKEKVSGIIVAGGRSSRIGVDKALLKVGGSTMIERIITVLQQVAGHVLISAGNGKYSFTGYSHVEDKFADIGPIGGIYSALKASSTPINIVVSCDLPFLSVDLLDYLLQNSLENELIIPVHNNFYEPLCAVYNVSLLPVIEQQINDGDYKLINLITKTDSKLLPITSDLPFYKPNVFNNINSIADYEQLKTMINDE